MLKRFAFVVLAGVLGIAALVLFGIGFDRLSEVRQLDRLPMTPLNALNDGLYATSGRIENGTGSLTAPYSQQAVVFVSYLLQEEYTDSKGKRKIRTLDSGSSATDFTLVDGTGRTIVSPGLQISQVDWQVRQTHRQQIGNRIYTEHSLRAGDRIELLARFDRASRRFELFDRVAGLNAIVSHTSLKIEGGKSLLLAGLWISSATGLLAVSLAALLVGLGIHRYWVFVLVMTFGLMAVLWTIGLVQLKKDWQVAAGLYGNRSAAVAAAAPNPAAVADLYAYYLMIERSARQWPDSLLFRLAAPYSFRVPSLAQEDQHRVRNRLAEIQTSRFAQQHWVLLLVAACWLATGLLIYFALRAIRFKRLVEFIPTSKTTGLTYGIAELFGMIDVDERYPGLLSNLNKQKCVAYHYRIEEKRGSGKNARWETLHDDSASTLFWLQDELGRVAVNPDGAKLIFPEKKVSHQGKLRHTESWLPPFRNIYCLGMAGIADAEASRLSIQNSADFTMLITTQSEQEVVRGQGALGFLLTGLALGTSLLAGTAWLAGAGSLTPLDLLQVSLLVPLTLALITTILHYNGLVFLKNRVDKTRADIDTLLQRRHDLWPQLQVSVQAFLAHEQELQTALRAVREGQTLAAGPHAIAQQLARDRQVMARLEAYPALKGNQLVQTFMAQMTRSEDELALIRTGYNAAVELYNNQIEQLPDLILAKTFGFSAAPMWQD